MTHNYILEMRNIIKEFPGVKALGGVSLKVRKGTVHALMGENGAGKSTLMKILMGIYEPNGGEVIFKGKKLVSKGTKAAIESGISMIHQELSPIPDMTVAENIYLGREPVKGFIVHEKELYRKTEELFKELDIKIDVTSKMKNLSTAYTQMVEIAKAISYNADLIIMDEPTSAITEKEVDHLFTIINKLRDKGVAIIYITHKMEEVFQITDEVTVLRDGEYVGTALAKDIDKNKLIEMMVGRELKEMFPKTFVDIKEEILEIRDFTLDGKFQNVSFNVRKGEIVGLAGLMGAGRSEVVESLFGINTPDSGEVYINGKKVDIKSPADAIKNGIGLLTEDRKLTGCFLPLALTDNMIMPIVDSYTNGLLISDKKVNDDCEEQRMSLNVKTPNLEQVIGNLSGGNQQKVLLARWMLTSPDILIVDEPTRGIDVGAKSEIHKLMCKLAGMGKAIIMISSEMPEVLGMSDRIVVMHEGKKTGELMREEATQEKVMELATGIVAAK